MTVLNLRQAWVFLPLFFLISCSSFQPKENKTGKEDSTIHLSIDTLIESRFLKPISYTRIGMHMVKINLLPDVAINWNERLNTIEDDSAFQKIKLQFDSLKGKLANEIRNEFLTDFVSCPDKTPLRAGDLAYMFIDKIDGIPFMHITGFQLDVFDKECRYPYFLFEYLQHNRSDMAKSVEAFLDTSHVLL